MERELLLLGLLRDHDMHGYQINEQLDDLLGDSVSLKKATVYRLLASLEESGWVNTYEEQEHNRPPRRVYAITEQGERQFERMLRESLADYRGLDLLGAADEMFWDALPPREAARLLRKRRSMAENRLLATYRRSPATDRESLVLRHHQQLLRAELQWLDDLIADATAGATITSVPLGELPVEVPAQITPLAVENVKPKAPKPPKQRRKPAPRSSWRPEFD